MTSQTESDNDSGGVCDECLADDECSCPSEDWECLECGEELDQDSGMCQNELCAGSDG